MGNMVGASDCSSANQTYTTLLIITDGIISDLDTTIDRIVAGSTMPLSIVIVGVGNADFGPMEVLDADDCPLHDRNGRRMARDIVQFVPFRGFRGMSPAMLAKAVLEEIPTQVVSYFQCQRISPNPVQKSKSVRSASGRDLFASAMHSPTSTHSASSKPFSTGSARPVVAVANENVNSVPMAIPVR